MNCRVSLGEPKIYWSDKGNYYGIRNEAAIQEVVHHVRQGHYCTVLGPPFCQKSDLLQHIKDQLQTIDRMVCVLLDLKQIDFVSDEEFLPALAVRIEDALQAQTGISGSIPSAEVTDERSMQRFLGGLVSNLGCDLVLLLDQLERVRMGPLQSLLKVLRAVFNERNPSTPDHLIVVIANALSMAALTLGETSPFNIARLVRVHDLTPEESRKLIAVVAQQKQLRIESAALQRCIEATRGDRYLISRLCERCSDVADRRQAKQITKKNIDGTLHQFVIDVNEATGYRPLQETIRALEANPTALMNVLYILEHCPVPRSELKLELTADIDDLQLTGAVRVDSIGGQQFYSIRNEVYEKCLRQHFQPDRVVHVLTMAGKWSEAIEYLDRLVASNQGYRSALLNTITDAIYSSQTEQEAYGYIGEPLTCAYRIPRTLLFSVQSDRSCLKPVNTETSLEEPPDRIFLNERGRPEIKAYFEQHYQVARDDSGQWSLYVPLIRDDKTVIGVVVLQDFEADPSSAEFLELLAFLRQVGRAVGAVIDREQQLRQLKVLRETGKKITSLDLDQVLDATVEGAIASVPAAQKGSLFLWDAEQQYLLIRSQRGFRADIVEAMKLGVKGDLVEGYAGWVYSKRKSLLLNNVWAHDFTKRVEHPDVQEEKSAICVPLEAWGRILGVLCLDNAVAYSAFQQRDLELLSTFGAQAALAIQNASVYAELHNLGMQINQGDLTPETIFEQTVRSITRVSGAEGANMLLLRDTDDPDLSVAQKPVLSVSDGLGDDYDANIHPRADGLTYHVLKTRKPRVVCVPEESPGINPLALERGTMAYLCLPMMIQDNIMGVMFVHQHEKHVFSENEIQMLSLFTNQAALAIQNTQQKEELMMTKAVAWMGIVNASLAHRIIQKAGAIRNTVFGLRKLVGEQPGVAERLDRIDESARNVMEIPGRALLPVEDNVEPVDLSGLLRQEIPRWCKPDDGIVLDFSGLTSRGSVVNADPRWLAVVVETLATNAARAMRNANDRTLTVRSEVRGQRKRGQRIVVEISNPGDEIPAEVRKKLFVEPVPKDQGVEGSGVGLLIARTIMRRYSGDIELVLSDSGCTTFSISLPLAQR